MKKLMMVLGLCLVSGAALAAMNLRQNSDGTADWVGGITTSEQQNCVGGALLPFTVTLNASTTDYRLSPITNAVFRDAFGTQAGTTTGNARVTFYINNTTTPVKFYNASNSTTTIAHIDFDPQSAGASQRISQAGEVSGAAGFLHKHLTSDVRIEKYQYIAVSSDGGATGAVSAQVIVQLCPR